MYTVSWEAEGMKSIGRMIQKPSVWGKQAEAGWDL